MYNLWKKYVMCMKNPVVVRKMANNGFATQPDLKRLSMDLKLKNCPVKCS